MAITQAAYISAKTRLLHMMRILDIFRPYSKGLKTGWHVSQYNDKQILKMLGRLFMLNLLCNISKKAPHEKFRREARWGVQVETAFCLVCLEPEKQILRILI